MTRGKEILELMAKLEEHPGTEAHRRLNALGWSVYTFDTNTRELLSMLDFLTQNPASWDLQALRRRDQLERAERDVVRRFHNMVAAVFSLVEHTRVLRRHMHDASMGPLYRDPATDEPIQRRIEREFADDSETKFFQDLRRFTQHRELPTLKFQISRQGPEDRVDRKILLSASQLLAWTGWSYPSKRFLERAGDKIDLRELVIRYEERVRHFYYDFETHYRELYREVLEERVTTQRAPQTRRSQARKTSLQTICKPPSPPSTARNSARQGGDGAEKGFRVVDITDPSCKPSSGPGRNERFARLEVCGGAWSR